MAFPINPTNGQTTTVNGVLYTYSSALDAWTVTSSGGALTVATAVSASGNITGSYFLGNGSQLSGVTATVDGNTLVGNTLSSNVVNSSLTSVGTLGSLSVTGNVTAGNLSGTNLSGTLTTASQTSITSVGTLGSLNVTGNIAGNNISTSTAFVTKTILETVTVNASAFANPSNYDILTQSVWYSTASASANFTLNIRGNSSVSANTLLGVGQSMTFALMVTNGATPYYPSAFQVDGSAITPIYQGGTAFSAGNANSTDVYSFTLIKTAATPTYKLLASQTKFA